MQKVIVNERYLDYKCIVPGKINILKSICGTGKTTAVKTFLEEQPILQRLLVPTFRRSLCSFLCSQFPNVANYLTCHEQRIDCNDYPRICISPESFYRYRDVNGDLLCPDVIIWDEFCSFLEHIVNTTTIKGYQRSYFIDNISRFFQNPNVTIIICDAYFEEDLDLQIIESMAGSYDRIRFVHNRYYQKKYKVYSYRKIGASEWKKRYFTEVLDISKKTYVFSNSKSLVEGLEKEYVDIKMEKMVELGNLFVDYEDLHQIVTADSCDREKEVFSSNPDDSWEGRIFMVSPTIQAGVSHTKLWFNRAFGFAIHGSSSVLSFCQQMARVRNLVDHEIHIMFPPDVKDIDEDFNVDQVWNNLAKYEKWTNFKVQELMEMEVIPYRDRNVNRPITKSILNNILVRSLYNKAKEKRSFYGEFVRYTQYDWYETKEVDVVMEFGENADNQVKYMRNIMNTFEQAKKFRLNYWENLISFNWDGSWPDDDWLAHNKGGCFEKWVEFCDEWNVFGVLGSVRRLNLPVFNTKRVSLFATKFCQKESQSNFHKLMVVPIHKLIDSDSLENRYNTYQFKGLVKSAISCIFGCYGIFNYEIEKNVVPGELNFLDNSTCSVISRGLPVYFVANEERLNNIDTFDSLCEELSRSYPLLVSEFNLKLNTAIPFWIKEKIICTAALKCLRKILDACLKHVGLERSKSPRNSLKETSVHNERIRTLNTTILDKKKKIHIRITVRSYNILNVHERIMMSLLKTFKKLPTTHPNNFVPDPFELLVFERAPQQITSLDLVQNDKLFSVLMKTWPPREELITFDWVEDCLIWAEKSKHYMQMTNADNVLDRFDYWNPMRSLDKLSEPLPEFFTRRSNPIREYQLRLPLRKWDDYPGNFE